MQVNLPLMFYINEIPIFHNSTKKGFMKGQKKAKNAETQSPPMCSVIIKQPLTLYIPYYIYIYICIYICLLYIYKYIYIYVCIYIYTCMYYIYIYILDR